jgi:uncharacterized membrane protein YhhN
MKTFSLSIIYFLIGLIFIIFQDHTSFLAGLVIKAFIIPTLIVLFMVNIRLKMDRLHKVVFAGLFFSWSGDLILEFSERYGDLFLAGLICFLLAHVMYLIVFFITPGKNIILRKHIYLLIPVIVYGIGLVYYLYNDLADMRVPVILYSIVIPTMLTGAISRLEKVNSSSYYLFLTGAIFFVISDSAIAINKFSHQFESSGTVIMSTYIIAQFLIIMGYIKQFREKVA